MVDYVTWEKDGLVIKTNVKRTPTIGWHTLTIVERLIDGVKTSLHIQEKLVKEGEKE